jgi:hypothetical protein
MNLFSSQSHNRDARRRSSRDADRPTSLDPAESHRSDHRSSHRSINQSPANHSPANHRTANHSPATLASQIGGHASQSEPRHAPSHASTPAASLPPVLSGDCGSSTTGSRVTDDLDDISICFQQGSSASSKNIFAPSKASRKSRQSLQQATRDESPAHHHQPDK